MLTDAQRDFLAGLRVEKSGASVIEIIDANGDGVAPVRWLSREMRYAEALEQADLIVAACHEAATWGTVIEAAKAGDAETWERTAHYLGQMWWGGDAEDVCRAIDSALKESSDEV
jgi:hypothetical protein